MKMENIVIIMVIGFPITRPIICLKISNRFIIIKAFSIFINNDKSIQYVLFIKIKYSPIIL